MPDLVSTQPPPPSSSAPRGLPPVLAPAAPPPPRAVAALPPLGSDVYPRLAVVAIAALAAVAVALHVAVNWLSPYGVHRDELLYMAMGRHLRMWEMDFPPFVALLSELTRGTFGDSLAAIRLGPALAAAATVVVAALTARVMGGFRTAQALAGLAVLTSPLFLRAGTLLQPVVFDQLWWSVALYALAHIGLDAIPTGTRRHNAWADGRPHRSPGYAHHAHRPRGLWPSALASLLDRPVARWWLLLGAAGGVGLLTKFSVAFLAAGVLVGLLATRPLRRTLATPWPWIAVAIAALIGAPSIAGQVALGWPVLGQLRELREVQLDRVGPLGFVAGQLAVGPAVALAAYGLWVLAKHEGLRPFRAVAWACGTAFLLLLALHGKAYYAGPIYPVLFAAGAVGLERATHQMRGGRRRGRLARGAAALVLVAFAAVTFPLALPVLPPAALARYADAFGAAGVHGARTSNRGERLAIPQDFADMLGWPEQVAAIARAMETLPPEARADAVILAGNYGEAGAVDFLGPRLGLPPVVSAAGSYWYFGPGTREATTAVAIGIPEATLRRYFRRVTPVERVRHDAIRWVVPEERDVVVAVCEEPLAGIQSVWESLRPY
jgi:4-amino-4-deoxy-L-arabinose transferase-like glycosyltransferase